MAKERTNKRGDYAVTFVRLPSDMRRWIEKQAKQSCTTMNAEMIRCVRLAMKLQAREEQAQ